MFRPSWLAAGIVLLGVASAHAQVYKCKAEDGRITYADRPCPGAGRVTELKIEHNVIETSVDRFLKDMKESQSAEERAGRDGKPSAACERAAREYEALSKAGGPETRTVKVAYDRVVALCVPPSSPEGADSAKGAATEARSGEPARSASSTASTEPAPARPAGTLLPPAGGGRN